MEIKTENEKALKKRKNFKEKLNELENNTENDNLISPRSDIRTDEDSKIPTSARSDQKLIETKKPRAKRDKSKTKKNEGTVNQGYESDAKPDSEPVKKILKPRKKTEIKQDKEENKQETDILGVIVHQTDRLRTDINIYNPVVRIHIIDLNTDGQYVAKPKKDRNTLYFYEKENRKLNYISPIMTTPFDFKKTCTILPRWEEVIVFNEDFSLFNKEQPNVLILFELLDLHKPGSDSEPSQTTLYTSQDTGKEWQRIAWAFLKLRAPDNSLNIEKKIRLQLFYSQTKYKQNVSDSLVPEIYNLYKNGPRVKYPSSLHVTVKAIQPPKKFTPGIGSSDLIVSEYLNIIYSKLNQDSDQQRSSQTSLNKENNEPEKDVFNSKLNAAIWSRIPGTPCRVPNDLALKLLSSKRGCYSIKFSTTGNFIACACVEDDSVYPIYVYGIPEGKLNMKFYGHFGLVYEISWSKLDKYFVTASNDATARVIDVESKSKEAYKILPHPNFLYSVKFHPESLDLIFTAGYDKVIRVWSIDSQKKKFQKYGELLQELHGHFGYVNSICFDSKGLNLYSADSAGGIKVWNCSDKNEWALKDNIQVEELKNQSISFIHLLPNEYRMLIQLRDNQLKLIDIRLKSITNRYKGTYNFSQNLKSAVSPCGTFLFNSSSENKIYCWNINTGDQVETDMINLDYLKPARDIDYHPFDNLIAFCSYDSNSPIYVFKFNIEKAAVNLGDTFIKTVFTKKDKLNSLIIDQSEPEIEEPIKENELNKNMRNDIDKFRDFQNRQLKEVDEKLLSVFELSKPNTKNDSINWSKHQLNSSITFSMPDKSKKPEFKYKGPKQAQEIVISLYEYKAQRVDELDLVKGDEILVLYKENNNWWMGQLLKNNQEGYFPASYVQDKSAIENIKKTQLNTNKIPKYTVKDALQEFEKVYEKPNLTFANKKVDDKVEIKDETVTMKKKQVSILIDKSIPKKNDIQLESIGQEPKVEIEYEIPTKDESNIVHRTRENTKRRTFAHIITGSHLTSSDI